MAHIPSHTSLLACPENNHSFNTEAGYSDVADVQTHHGINAEKHVEHEPILVTWSGPFDSDNPKNWKRGRKWTVTILVSCFTFISPFSSTMVTPALDDISRDLNVPPGFTQQLIMSIFLLGYAQGPFVLAPLSEIFGRAIVLQSANLMYLVFNLACGFSQTRQQLLAFRFLSGVGGSAPQAVSAKVRTQSIPEVTDPSVDMQRCSCRLLAKGGAW